MRFRPWVELLLPTLMVGLGWFVVSGATTGFILWLDSEHERVMSENVSSIEAAAEMQFALWRMFYSHHHPAENDLTTADITEQLPREFLTALNNAEASWSTPGERAAIAALRERFVEYADVWVRARRDPSATIDQERLADMAAAIAEGCKDVRRFNEDLIRQRTVSYQNWTQRILWARLLIVLVGPPLGVWIGFRMATRVGRRIANIQVSLAGVSSELGTVQISTTRDSGYLLDVEDQVRTVADRIRVIVKQLHDAQREARQNERLASIGQLAAGVAHGLRNPLTAVKLLVQTVLASTPLSGTAAQQLTVVQDEVLRMEQTIQSLLNFAKPPALQYSRANIGESLQRAINLVQGRATHDGIRIEYHAPTSAIVVRCDVEQLHQVFVNILLNGMDALPAGGIMQIDARVIALPREVDAGGHDEFCEIEFRDNGPGIPPELVDRIFDPFITTKAQGTGLGLAISRRYVEEHGGRLSAANSPDGGACFVLRLPLHTTMPGEDEETSATNMRAGSQSAGV